MRIKARALDFPTYRKRLISLFDKQRKIVEKSPKAKLNYVE